MPETLDPGHWTAFFVIAGVWAVTVISPGPNFIATVHAALSQSRGTGIWVSLGIMLGTTVWATASLAGLALLFQQAAWLYTLVKFAGAAYLIYLGVRMIRSARSKVQVPAAPGPGMTPVQAFRRGLLTDLANPKAAAFFASLFAVTVPPAAPLWYDAAVVVMVVIIAGAWYALMACVMTLNPVATLYRRAQRAVAYVTGALFMAIGVRLAAER
ncbi:MAG: LysE family translocator [Alphaproteobacteria bacterium]|nr:LysE family translocator [Alphaproteobacteria bacterium]